MSIRSRTASSKQPSSSATTSEDGTQPESPNLLPTPSFSQRALASTAHLANLLPTGTLLAFQLLTPVFTNNGSCDAVTRHLTLILLVILEVSCFLACFTDSFKAPDGKVYHGFATFKGMWLFDYAPAAVSGLPPDLSKHKIKFIDAVHAVLSVFVFGAIALRDKNVVSCFYPHPGHETQEVLDIVPLGIGLLCSFLFVVFPTRRHGIGFPVAIDNDLNLK